MVTFTCTCHMLSKIYSISSTAIFLAKRIAAMTYGVNQVKKVRNILTRVQLSVVYEGPCSTEPVNTFKKRRRALSCILNKAGMGKNYIMQNNIQGYQQYHLLNVSLITIPSFRLVHIKNIYNITKHYFKWKYSYEKLLLLLNNIHAHTHPHALPHTHRKLKNCPIKCLYPHELHIKHIRALFIPSTYCCVLLLANILDTAFSCDPDPH
jgi:hypothetical protein